MTKILIDCADPEQDKPSYLFEKPVEILQTHHLQDMEPMLEKLEKRLDQGLCAAGFLSYEAGYGLETRFQSHDQKAHKVLLFSFNLFETFETLNAQDVTRWLDSQIEGQNYQISNLQSEISEVDYLTAFEHVQKMIAQGDIYQLNLTFKNTFDFSGNPFALYKDLKRKQRMRCGGLIVGQDFSVISASPEVFLQVDGQQASTSPMKGTAKRHPIPAEDEAVKHWLRGDIKSRAENLMIVDLMRNDLGRISQVGSVQVPELYKVETYPTLHQMVSTVISTLQPDVSLKDMFKALYPAGSITGAPKIRAMELIREIEPSPRGVYTGSVGMILPKKDRPQYYDMFFNVAIRTLFIDSQGKGELGLGSGVVADSDAQEEYKECFLKAAFLKREMPEFDLLETLKLNPHGSYVLLDRHMERLGQSAAYFGYRFDEAAIGQALEEKAASLHGSDTAHRVRLLLAEDGAVSITSTVLPNIDKLKTMRFVIADTPMQSDNVYLYHKTTHRHFYDEPFARLTAEHGVDEVVFVNERGELTEGSRTNIFLEKNGQLYTPALSCGLLAGCLRAELLAKGDAIEAVLTLEDLEKADRVYLGNSVRGMVKANLYCLS
jgi:para-aminobenzoate synthetase/4-amino-4-deoxychorismate lyase